MEDYFKWIELQCGKHVYFRQFLGVLRPAVVLMKIWPPPTWSWSKFVPAADYEVSSLCRSHLVKDDSKLAEFSVRHFVHIITTISNKCLFTKFTANNTDLHFGELSYRVTGHIRCETGGQPQWSSAQWPIQTCCRNSPLQSDEGTQSLAESIKQSLAQWTFVEIAHSWV